MKTRLIQTSALVRRAYNWHHHLPKRTQIVTWTASLGFIASIFVGPSLLGATLQSEQEPAQGPASYSFYLPIVHYSDPKELPPGQFNPQEGTATSTPSVTPSMTLEPATPSATLAATSGPASPTQTVSASSTSNVVPSTTLTPTKTATSVASTVVPSGTATNTATLTPSKTATRTATPTSTWTPTATSTSTDTPVPPTSTRTPTATSTDTPVPPTSTSTPTATSTDTPVPPTSTWTPTATSTDTPVPPTATATETATATATATETATATATATATTTSTPTISVLAQDSFSRNETSGWGNADVGGAYTLWPVGTENSFSTNGSVGQFSHLRGESRSAILNGVSVDDIDMSFKVSIDNLTTEGGSAYAYGVARRDESAKSEYRAQVRIQYDGKVYMKVTRYKNDTESDVGLVSSSLFTIAAGDQLNVRFQVENQGDGGVYVRMKAWRITDSEPSAWQINAYDDPSNAIINAGGVGLRTFISASAMEQTYTYSFDDFMVQSLP